MGQNQNFIPSLKRGTQKKKKGGGRRAYGVYLPCLHRNAIDCNVLLWDSNPSTQNFPALRLVIYKYARITVTTICLNMSLSSQLSVEWIMRIFALIQLITLRSLVVLCFLRFLSRLPEVFTTFSAWGIWGIARALIAFVM